MKLYARYLLWQLALPTLLATLAFSGAVWLSQSLRFVDLIVNKGLPVTTFLYLTLLLFPSLLLVILPFALFCAVLYVYHRLSLESELTVMKASGLSNLQIAAPCLALAGTVTALGYALALYVMPLTYEGFRELQYEVRRDLSHVLLQPGVFNTPVEDVTVFVRDHEEDGSLSGILVHDDRNKRLPVTMMAEQGFLVQGANGPLFVLQRGSRQELDTRAVRESGASILRFGRYTLDLASAAGRPDDRSRKPKELYLHELLDPQDEMSEVYRRELIAEGHRRLTWPLNALVFALVGLACLLPREYSRHGPWRSILLAVVGAAAVQAASVVAGSLASRSIALIPLMYAAPLVPAIACIALLLGDRPRRPGPMPEAGPA